MHYLEISINWLKAPDLHVLAYNATNYANTSLSGEETDMFCRMSFLLQKVGQAKQSLPHTVTRSIKT